jgi:hypothetical protein
VQQYYHFLSGYLAPIMLWQDSRPARAITVRDCGPMNRWFSLIPPDTDVDIMNVGHFLHVFAGKLQPCHVLRGLDFPQEFDAAKLGRFRELSIGRAADRKVSTEPPARVTVIDRLMSDRFYSSSESEIDMAGAQRRSVPNLSDWANKLSVDVPLGVFEMTELEVNDQIALAADTRVLVAQQGAGLPYMVFMRPGGVVVEIHPLCPRRPSIPSRSSPGLAGTPSYGFRNHMSTEMSMSKPRPRQFARIYELLGCQSMN